MSNNPLWNPAWEQDMYGFRPLTQNKANRPDMSGNCYCNLNFSPDKIGWDLATEELGLSRICPVLRSDMSSMGY
jgi:hypothetical protein